MKYFYDTEFLEGTQKKWFGKTKQTIDLISIGIVAEDGREYYAISKDFNLKEAWNRYDVKIEQVSGDMRNRFPNGIEKKVYWIRENVLKSIFIDLTTEHVLDGMDFTYKNLKKLLKLYGKTNFEIANDLKKIALPTNEKYTGTFPNTYPENIELYGYYSAYDHVVFCWLFGKMIDLPKGFPMYTIDLQQEKERIYAEKKNWFFNQPENKGKVFISDLKHHLNYPRQTNEHNALADAHWNRKLYNFLKGL